jgi:hypothetical protein
MKKMDCLEIAFDALLSFNRNSVAILENRNKIYAQPLIGIFKAISKEPSTAPQKEICSTRVFIDK